MRDTLAEIENAQGSDEQVVMPDLQLSEERMDRNPREHQH